MEFFKMEELDGFKILFCILKTLKWTKWSGACSLQLWDQNDSRQIVDQYMKGKKTQLIQSETQFASKWEQRGSVSNLLHTIGMNHVSDNANSQLFTAQDAALFSLHKMPAVVLIFCSLSPFFDLVFLYPKTQ